MLKVRLSSSCRRLTSAGSVPASVRDEVVEALRAWVEKARLAAQTSVADGCRMSRSDRA